MLENWIITIDDQIAQLEMGEETYLDEINALAVEIRNLDYQRSLLDADFNTYRNTYETLQKKHEEIALTMSDLGSGYVKLASVAAVPDERLPHNTVRNTLIGGIAGGFLGLAGVITINHLVRMLEDRIGKKAQITHHDFHPADVRTNQADVTRAGDILGWEPQVDLEAEITLLVDWYTQERQWASQVETP